MMAKKKVTSKKKPITWSVPEPFSRNHIFVYGILILLAFILYGQGISYGFVLDDKIVLSQNSFTKEGFKGILDIFSHDSFQGYFGQKKDLLVGGRYRPLSLACFAVLYEFFGLNPEAYHFTNILFYGIACALFYYLLKMFFPKEQKWWWSVPFLSALLYLAHPVHVEAVANIKGLDEILALVFIILSWIFYLRSYRNDYLGKSYLFPFMAGSACYLAALLSKENAIPFLAIIPLSIWILGRWNTKKVLFHALPLLLVAICYVILRTQILGYLLSPEGLQMVDPLNHPFVGMDWDTQLGTIFRTWWIYLRLLFVPFPLLHDYYPYAVPISSLWTPISLLSIFIHLGLLIFGVRAFYKKKIMGWAILVYFFSFSIVSNLFFSVGATMNERFIFIPSLGFAIAMGYIIYQLSQKYASVWMYGLSIIMLVAYSWIVWDRLPDWKNAYTLNASAVSVNDRSARSTLFMGTALFNQAKEENLSKNERLDRLIEARGWINRSLQIFPTYGNEVTQNYKYFNAYKMKAGIAAEIYNINQDLPALLDEFKETLINRPDIGFVKSYLSYVQSRKRQKAVFEDFYHEVAIDNLVHRKEYMKWALFYIDLGLEAFPNSARLLYDKGRILEHIVGREAEGKALKNRAISIDPNIQ